MSEVKYSAKDIARFWEGVDKSTGPDGCWNWTASDGWYGNIWWCGRQIKTHRVAWMLTHGDIPKGMAVCHHCDNPACCNPQHLFVGTRSDNMRDMWAKGRQRDTSLPGKKNPRHKLTAEDVIEIRRLYAQGDITQVELARRFGVDQTQISCIVLRKSWKNLP